MSGFTNEALEKKLTELNNSQQSIQTLSLWLIHHRKHNKAIVHTWYKELKKAKTNRRLTFMYLANDVIQNSRKKGPEFTKEFSIALKPAFEFMARDSDPKTLQSLERIIRIWHDRNIYEPSLLDEFRKSLLKKPTSSSSSDQKAPATTAAASAATAATSSRASVPAAEKHNSNLNSSSAPVTTAPSTSSEITRQKRKTPTDASSSKSSSNNNHGALSNSKKPKAAHFTSLNTNLNLLSHSECELPINGQDVNPDELIKSLIALQHSASSDAAIRENISKLPPEVSDIALVEKVRSKRDAEHLRKKVEDACDMLTKYNNRLSQELEERKQVSITLAAFCRYQRDSVQKAEKRLEEYRERLRKVSQVKDELKAHLQNLPDLTLLPSVTAGLAPLPKPENLFTVKSPGGHLHHHQTSENGGDGSEASSSPAQANLSPLSSSSSTTLNKSPSIPASGKFDDLHHHHGHSYVPTAVKFNEAGGLAAVKFNEAAYVPRSGFNGGTAYSNS